MPDLQMRLLGTPIIEMDHKPVEVSSRKAVALLAYLAVSGQAISRDSLATMFWPDQDQSRARAYLRNTLWVLSQAGLDPWLDTGREAVALSSGIRLDVAEFQEQHAQTSQHGHAKEVTCPACIPPLEKAAVLYRGDFLVGFTLPDSPEFDEWQFFQAESLRKQLVDSLERLVRFYDGEGNWMAGIGHARRWVALDPLNEIAQRWLMRLYARSGNRSLALKQYEILREVLDKELGVAPEDESNQLYTEILEQRGQRLQKGSGLATLSPPVTLERPRHNLPAELTRFIGREKEIAEITAALAPGAPGANPVRLLTLTGPGGSGKTRLALKVASQLIDHYADGVFFAGLAVVDHPERVAAAIAHTLGQSETPGRSIPAILKDSLASKQLLLLLDNFEHLITAAPLVSDLLAAAPRLSLLVTSREVLHIYGEQAYPVPPLALPPLDASNQPDHLVQYEAVQLFIDRARAVQPGFEVGAQEARLIAEICARLDGLPLAIELAAARLRLFSLEALLNQLSDRFGILRGGPRDLPDRQRTLRATIDWSYNLLDKGEQRLFARLSVFQDGCSLEAFEQVCGLDGGPPALDGLESLIEKSLVIQDRGPDGEPRFAMLETIHAYAREKLADFGEAGEISSRHARFFAGLARRAEAHLRGGPQLLLWLQRLECEHENLRAALDWCLSGGNPPMGMQLAASLMFFWVRQDHPSEGRGYIERALALSDRAPTAVKARLFQASGMLAYFRQDLEAALAGHQNAVRLFKKVDDPGGLGWALVFYGGTLGMLHPSRYLEAMALCDEGLDILRRSGDKPRIIQGLNYVGELARVHGDYQKAKVVYEECLALSREIGDSLRELMMVNNLGYVAVREGDYPAAEALYHPGLRLALQINLTSQVAGIISSLSGLYAALNQPEKGARLMGAGEAMLERNGLVQQPADQMEIERYQSNLRSLLGDTAYEQAVTLGRQMSLEEVIALALE